MRRGLLYLLLAMIALVAGGIVHPLLGLRLVKLATGFLGTFVLIWSAWGAGRVVLGRRAEEVPATWALLLGLGVLSTVVYVSAAFGVFTHHAAPALLVFGIFMRGLRVPRTYPRAGMIFPWEALPAMAALAVTVGTPVVFWDSCSYHLAIPEHILATGSLVSKLDYVYGFYSQAMECLYALVLWMPHGETAAEFLNVSLIIAAGFAAIGGLDRTERRLGISVVLATPAVLVLMSLPKNSGLLAFAGAVGFEAVMKSRARGAAEAANQSEETADPAPWIAGAAVGAGFATHYGGLWSGAFLLGVLWLRSGRGAFTRALLSSAPFAAPILLRNLLLTGNPLFPFLGFIFHPASTVTLQSVGVDEPGPIVAALFARATSPWVFLEPLGVGSTLGIILPVGLAAAIIAGRLKRSSELQWRLAVGLGILLAGTLLHSRPRYGIGGYFILIPVITAGLREIPRIAQGLLAAHAAAGALLVLFSGFAPLANLTVMNDDVYRYRYNPASPLAEWTVANLPPRARIASAGILRPYRWKGLLEYTSEYEQPDLTRVIEKSGNAAAAIEQLRLLGYTHIAFDPGEWDRLRRGYGHLALSDSKATVFFAILNQSEPIAQSGRVTLFRLKALEPTS